MGAHATWIREKLFLDAEGMWVAGPRQSGMGRRLTIVTDLDGLTLTSVAAIEVLHFLEARHPGRSL